MFYNITIWLSQCCLEIVNLNWCFAEILHSLHIELSPPEFEQLAVKYDIKNSGRLSYPDFLRHFVLMFSPQVNTSSSRLKLQLPTTPVSSLQLQPAVILSCYRPVRFIQHFLTSSIRWTPVHLVDSVLKPCWEFPGLSSSSGGRWGKNSPPLTKNALERSLFRTLERYKAQFYAKNAFSSRPVFNHATFWIIFLGSETVQRESVRGRILSFHIFFWQ